MTVLDLWTTIIENKKNKNSNYTPICQTNRADGWNEEKEEEKTSWQRYIKYPMVHCIMFAIAKARMKSQRKEKIKNNRKKGERQQQECNC